MNPKDHTPEQSRFCLGEKLIRPNRRTGAALAAAWCAAWCTAWAQPAPAQDQAPAALTARYDAASESYRIGHYRAAFDAFAELADAGHCDAMRIARQMSRHGQALYSLELPIDPQRRERWQRAGACIAAQHTARR